MQSEYSVPLLPKTHDCEPTLRRVVVLWLGILLGWTGMSRAMVTLVSQGQPKGVIVVPAKASRAAREGAEILRDHLLQISGAQLRMLTEDHLQDAKVADERIETGAGESFVLVGAGQLAKKLGITNERLGPGGFVIRAFGNVVILLGADDKTPSDPYGSRYAVTTFLENVLGCRYLWPGESGKVVPKRKTIQVERMNMRHKPLFKQRKIRWSGYSSRIQQGIDRLGFTKEDFLRLRKHASSTVAQSGNWMEWHRMGGTLGLKTGDGTILPKETWEKFIKEHPEWFAMQLDGSRYFDVKWERPRLCKSNRELVEAIAREKIRELENHPGQKSVSLMTQDGGSKAGFCMCLACKALDEPEGRAVRLWTYDHKSGRTERFDYVSLTDRMAHFYNAVAERVAKKYPHVLFTGQAYSIYAAPPLREKLHPNMVIRLVHRTDHYANDAARALGMADWDAWANAVRMIYWRPNSLLWGRFEGTTGVYLQKLAEDFRHIAQNKCIGTDFDSCMHHWATQGLNYYVLAKLHWNADLDVEQVVDDYCRSGFGDGWRDIRQYLLRIEQLTSKSASIPSEGTESKTHDLTLSYTNEVLSELRGYLEAAYRATKGQTLVRHRISFLRTGLDFTGLQAKIYRLLELSKQRRLNADEQAEAVRLLDEKYLMMCRIFEQHHFAMNAALICWGEWWRFRRLGWEGPSENIRSKIRLEQR